MKTLEFICPWCMTKRSQKIDLTCHYEDNDLIIPWECPCCKFKGEWKREIRKPSMFVANARAKMLIYLLENKLMELPHE